jgi:C4-dicarboxylate transporter, DctM subunit
MTTSTKQRVSESPPSAPRSAGRLRPWMPQVIATLAVLGCLAGLFTSPTRPIAGAFVVALMIVLMFLGVPVAVALAVPSVIGIYAIAGIPATMNVLSTAPHQAVATWSLSVLPMFIFMGMLLSSSGLATKMYRAADAWFGWMPGGIGIGTTAAGAGLASVSGSTIGMTYTLGQTGIPEMLRAGYDRRIAVGTVIVAGLPGNLIPPSILLVVYAGLASVPVGPQLIAGFLPGVLIALMFGLFLLLLAIAVPSLMGRTKGAVRERVSLPYRLKTLRDVWSFPVIMAVLFGTMFTGVFTPTESGAAAAMVTLLVAAWSSRKTGPHKMVAEAATNTVSATAAIFFLLIGAELLTRVLAISGLARFMTDFVVGLDLGKVAFLLALVVLYIVMGMFFDTLSMMLLTIPLLLPTLALMEVDLLWFGVFVVLLGELGMITPPVGVLSYVVHSLAQRPEVNLGQTITLRDVFTSLTWFLPLVVVFLVAMIFFPAMATWLPSHM